MLQPALATSSGSHLAVKRLQTRGGNEARATILPKVGRYHMPQQKQPCSGPPSPQMWWFQL
eukprot:1952739-Amphidinium_carterae.1